MKHKFRFVGSETEMGDVRLEKLGDLVELTETEADLLVYRSGGAPLITDEQFASAGFTADEMKQYAFWGQRADAPAEFHRKLAAARAFVGKRPAKKEAK